MQIYSTGEGQEFEKLLRSLKQFIQSVKGQNNLWQHNLNWKKIIAIQKHAGKVRKMLMFVVYDVIFFQYRSVLVGFCNYYNFI